MSGISLQSLTCNHCGAPLEVPALARFITCGHCGSRLAVHRTGSAAYTEVLEQIGERTERIAQDVEAIRLQNELERIDREWHLEQERYLVRDEDGSTSLPNAVGAVVGAVVAVIFLLFWIGGVMQTGAPAFFPLFGILGLLVVVFGAISSFNKAGGYQDAERSYRERRAAILQRLREEGMPDERQ